MWTVAVVFAVFVAGCHCQDASENANKEEVIWEAVEPYAEATMDAALMANMLLNLDDKDPLFFLQVGQILSAQTSHNYAETKFGIKEPGMTWRMEYVCMKTMCEKEKNLELMKDVLVPLSKCPLDKDAPETLKGRVDFWMPQEVTKDDGPEILDAKFDPTKEEKFQKMAPEMRAKLDEKDTSADLQPPKIESKNGLSSSATYESGVPGQNGVDGAPGPQGERGPPGQPGQDGEPGIPIAIGKIGIREVPGSGDEPEPIPDGESQPVSGTPKATLKKPSDKLPLAPAPGSNGIQKE